MVSEDVTLRLYGSSLSGVGLKESDVNVDVSGGGPAPALLIKVFTLVCQKGGLSVVSLEYLSVCICTVI